jgi:DNA repair protein RadC
MTSPGDKETCPFCEKLSRKFRHSHIIEVSSDALIYLEHFKSKQQEYLIALSLDSGNRLIARRIVTIGLLDTALAHPREIYVGAVEDRAASLIIAHNHPSGDTSPSKADVTMTQQIAAAGILLGIPLRDHIIIAGQEHYSFRKQRLL